MRWKALFAAVIILGIVGFLLISETGQKYLQFLREGVGNFISVILRRTQPSGEVFEIVLKSNKEAFHDQSYNLDDSDFSISGFYSSIKIGDLEINKKAEKIVSISLKEVDGLFEYTKEGSVKFSGDSNYIEIDDDIYSSAKVFRIELEIIPLEFSLTNLVEGKITLSSVTGEIKRFYDEKVDSVSLINSKIEIDNFKGELKLTENEISLEGMAGSVVGDKFTFK